MTLRTRLGNLGNILDESPNNVTILYFSRLLSVILNGMLKHHLGEKAVEIDWLSTSSA